MNLHLKECSDCSGDNFFCETCGGVGPFVQGLRDIAPTFLKNNRWEYFDCIPSKYNPYYIYFVKQYVATLDRTSQVAYYHYIAGVPINQTSLLLGLSERQIKSLLERIYDNVQKFFEDERVYNRSETFYKNFYNILLDPAYDDDDIANAYDEEVAVIKITRAYALKAHENAERTEKEEAEEQ
jgi:hypothetical protein